MTSPAVQATLAQLGLRGMAADPNLGDLDLVHSAASANMPPEALLRELVVEELLPEVGDILGAGRRLLSAIQRTGTDVAALGETYRRLHFLVNEAEDDAENRSAYLADMRSFARGCVSE